MRNPIITRIQTGVLVNQLKTEPNRISMIMINAISKAISVMVCYTSNLFKKSNPK